LHDPGRLLRVVGLSGREGVVVGMTAVLALGQDRHGVQQDG
jgi:hypothetical protein